MGTPDPQPSTSAASEDPEEKARKKEARRQLTQELAQIRAMRPKLYGISKVGELKVNGITIRVHGVKQSSVV
jgi:hypothetical protein